MVTRARLEQEILDLTAKLQSPVSDIGDWKITKCLEYEHMGLECPYDLESVMKQRQSVRDRINEIQDILKTIPVNEDGMM